jgi:hypothetical protein
VVSAADPLQSLISVFYTRAATFLSSSSSFTLTRAEWTPFQTHCYSENLVAPGIEPGSLEKKYFLPAPDRGLIPEQTGRFSVGLKIILTLTVVDYSTCTVVLLVVKGDKGGPGFISGSLCSWGK